VVSLGALGVITKVTLQIQPTYMMRQYVYENLPLAQVRDHFDAIEASAHSGQPLHRLAKKTASMSYG